MSISYNSLNKNKLYLSANPTYLLILKFFISGKNTNISLIFVILSPQNL